MNIEQLLNDHYGIDVTDIKQTEFGSGNTYYIYSNQQIYIGKLNVRKEFIYLYSLVEPVLKNSQMKHQQLIKMKNNEWMVDNFVLYQYINGTTSDKLTLKQMKNALTYMKKYHKLLGEVSLTVDDFPNENHWDKARNLDYLIEELIKKTRHESIIKAIHILQEKKIFLDSQSKQLLHADLGADNFLFNEDDVICIIDFTPDYQHELYGLAQFLFWNYLWDNRPIKKEEILYYLKIYNCYIHQNDFNNLYLYLIQSTLYRILGLVYENPNANISKRLNILTQLLEMR